MSTQQDDADAYGQELALNSHHQRQATAPRLAGIHGQADDIVAKLEATAVVGTTPASPTMSTSSP